MDHPREVLLEELYVIEIVGHWSLLLIVVL